MGLRFDGSGFGFSLLLRPAFRKREGFHLALVGVVQVLLHEIRSRN